MKGRQRKLEKEFTFAGFDFPRYIAEIPRGTKEQRQKRYQYTGGYYHAPKPGATGHGFYLDSAGSPARWKWADEIRDARIDHRGWYTDEYGISEKIRGIVILLPHGRYLAGWSMGEGMASELDYTIYDDETDAARAADEEARIVAENEREYQEQEEERIRKEEEELEHNQGGDAEETEGY